MHAGNTELCNLTIIWINNKKEVTFTYLSGYRFLDTLGWTRATSVSCFAVMKPRGKKINLRGMLLWFCLTWLSYLIFLDVKSNSSVCFTRSWHYFYLCTQHLSLNFLGVAACYLLLRFLVVFFRFSSTFYWT